MSIDPFPLCLPFKFLDSFFWGGWELIYTWQKLQGWWSVVWEGKKSGFVQMLICSFVHSHFYVNICAFLTQALIPKNNFLYPCCKLVLPLFYNCSTLVLHFLHTFFKLIVHLLNTSCTILNYLFALIEHLPSTGCTLVAHL